MELPPNYTFRRCQNSTIYINFGNFINTQGLKLQSDFIISRESSRMPQCPKQLTLHTALLIIKKSVQRRKYDLSRFSYLYTLFLSG